MVTFWKCYFPPNFSHFLSFQTNFILQNPPPPTHQQPQKIHHYPHKTHHHTTQKSPKRHHPHHHNNNKKKSEIKERKQIGDKIDLEEEIDRRVADDEIDLEEEMIWPRGGQDRSSSGRLHVAWSRQDDLGDAKLTMRSRRHVWGWGTILPACLVAWSRRLSTLFSSLSLSLSLSLCTFESENGLKWK